MDGQNALAGRYLLVAVRTIERTYAEGRQAEPFEAARRQQLNAVMEADGARAVVMGFTTIALSDQVGASG